MDSCGTNTMQLHATLADIDVGDKLLVRRRNSALHIYSTMTVSQVKDTFVIARQSATRSRVPGRGVVCFRVTDGVEQASGGSPRRGWPLKSDEAQLMIAPDPNARRQIERQQR